MSSIAFLRKVKLALRQAQDRQLELTSKANLPQGTQGFTGEGVAAWLEILDLHRQARRERRERTQSYKFNATSNLKPETGKMCWGECWVEILLLFQGR
jgi:hypothetical protein